MAMDDFQKEQVKKALEAKRWLEEAGIDHSRLNSTDSMIQEAKKQALIAQERRAQLPSHTVNIKPLLEAIESLRQPIPWELIQGKKEVDELLRNFGRGVVDIRNAVNAAAEPVARFFDRWQEANKQLEELIRRSSAVSPLAALARSVTSAYEVNATAVAQFIREQNLVNTNPALGVTLTMPTVRYVDFSRRTINQISTSDDPREKVALGGSLVIAQEQVTESTDLIEEVTSGQIQLVETVPADSPVHTHFNAYDAAQQDLLAVADIPAGADYPALRGLSTAAVIAEKARALVRAVIRCNKNSQLRGGEDVFKPTNTLAEACITLPGLIVRGEDDLRNLIYYLYMIFYEGAGKDKLRYIEQGLVTAADCEVIWTLKGLRNKWHEHDPEHGDAGKIRANYRNLREALNNLGFSTFPSEPREFEEIQLKLITRLSSLVEKIDGGLAAKT